MDEPQMIQVQSEEVTVDTIEQRVIETTDRAKPDALRFVMDRDQPFQQLFSVVQRLERVSFMII